MGQARIRLEFAGQVVEVEGSEEFVANQIRELRAAVAAGSSRADSLLPAPEDDTADQPRPPRKPARGGTTISPKGGRRAKGSRLTVLQIVHELDLKGWKEFAEAKRPSSTIDRYMTAAKWLKDERGVDAVDAHQINTCFVAAGWKRPRSADPNQPFRDAKKKYGGFVGAEEPGHYLLTQMGEDRVAGLPLPDRKASK